MSKVRSAWLALAMGLLAGTATAGGWRCGATASFSEGSVQAWVLADDHGVPTQRNSAAFVEYKPGPQPRWYQLAITYAATLQDNAMVPTQLVALLRVKRNAAGGQVVLTVGDGKASWVIQPAFFAQSDEFAMWINERPNKLLSDTLVAGGQGRLSILGKDGQVKESQDFNILGTAQLLPLAAKAYPVALGFASAPKHSEHCEPDRPAR
jgi:hypothetical protein